MSVDVETRVPDRGPRRSRAATWWILALAVLLAGSVVGGVVLVIELQRLQGVNAETSHLNDEQRRFIDEQNEMLDEKATFGAAMEEFMATAHVVDGLPIGDIAALDEIEVIAREAWEARRSPVLVAGFTTQIAERTADLRSTIDAAAAQLASTSGTLAESLVNDLAAGHVRVVYDDPAALCGGDPIGCVSSEDPTLIHLDPTDYYADYFDDELRRLVTYHEFAHVLQFTNPTPTQGAAAAFDDEWEFMADCYALTVTDSWELERRVWRDGSSYWDVAVGYGRVCDESQREVIRGWLAEVGFHYRPVSQEAA